jgi:hypothetical protein
MQKDEQLTNTSVNARIESLDDAPSILQSKSSDIQIETKIPELKIVTIEKPEQSEKKLGFIKKLKGETPITEPEPKITFPVEKENPTTGEVITIEQPVDDRRNELPIIIETPTGGSGGGGGGGGSSDYFERGGGYGREQVFERDMNQRENIQ